jgi:hypothetical protein
VLKELLNCSLKEKMETLNLTLATVVPQKRGAFIFDGPSRDALLQEIQEQLDIPVASITDAEEVSVLL